MSRAAYITKNDNQGAAGGGQRVQPDRARVIAALQGEMADAGATNDSVADGIGMTRYTFGRRMSGATGFYICELAAICGYLNIPLGRLLEAAKSG